MFTDINWSKITNSTSVLLIVCPAVSSELDKKKHSDNDINIRNRAQRVISKMSKMATSNLIYKIEKNLDLLFISREPSIDWEKEGLSAKIPDDRIIASILEQKNYFNNIILISSDLGLKLKARNKEIKCISLPDEYLLKIKKDKRQKEIEKLRNKIAFLENRLPILKLKILADNEPADFIKITINRVTNPSKDELMKKVRVIKDELKYKPAQKFGILTDLLLYTKDEIERYEKDLDKYTEGMLKYYQEEYKFKEIQSRLIKLKFVIINVGNQPAEDIEIFTNFPDGFIMFSEDELAKKPKEPEKPSPPRTQQEMIFNFQKSLIPSFPSSYIPSIITSNINQNLSSGPKIRKTNSYEVKYGLDKLKHGIQKYLKPVYILFESINLAKSFKISYSILADNLPEPSNGNLNIVILSK
jgi:hypothetical protein